MFKNFEAPKIFDNIILKEDINISRALELLNPKYKLCEEHLDKLKTYIGFKNKSLNDEYSSKGVYGRMYSKTSSQFLPSEIRATLFNKCYDIDMKACAPSIIKNVLVKLDYKSPVLDTYLQDRKKIIKELAKKYKKPESDFKTIFNSILMGMGYENVRKECDDKFLLDFWHECFEWRKVIKNIIDDDTYIYNEEKLTKLKEEGKSTSKDKVAGLIFDIENRCLLSAYEYLKSLNIKVHTLIFDGLIADSIDFELDELNEYVFNKTGFKIEFINKPMENKYFDVLPVKKEFNYNIFNSFKNYESAKAYFEEHWVLIDNPFCLINKNNLKDYRKFNLHQFKINFKLEFKSTTKNKKGESKETKIHFWDIHKTEATKHTSIDFLPPPLKSEYNYTFNLFTGFDIEKTIDYDDSFSTDIYHEHIRHLVNYDDKSYKYLVDYLADIVQFPGRKQDICLIFKSSQGTGKNLFFESFGDIILGEQYRLTAENPEQVLGRFNGNHNKLLVIMDEMKARKADPDSIKNLITAKNLNYEKKGLDMIQLKNLARYIILTNNDVPVKIESSDRRFVLFETSSKYIGSSNIEYFQTLAEALNNPHKMRVFYNELMNRVITTDFRKDRPITEQYKLLKELTSKDTIESFFHDYVENHSIDERKIKTWYEIFQDWCTENKIINFELSQNAFTQRSKIKGLLKQSKIVKGTRYYQLTVPLNLFGEDDEPTENSSQEDEYDCL